MHKQCKNSGNTGQTSTSPNTGTCNASLPILIQGPGFVLPAENLNERLDFYSRALVEYGPVQNVQAHIEAARIRLAMRSKLHSVEGDVRKLACVECERVAGGGNYTLYVCTYHCNMTLVCTYCQTAHDAIHELALDQGGKI